MADQTPAPVATGGNPADALSDFSQVGGAPDTADVDAQYDPQINEERAVAQRYEDKSVAATEEAADQALKGAGDMSAEEQQINQWAAQTPTRQAAYANTMKMAPVLAMLTALGGKMTRLTGMDMLAATNGIVQGMNAGAEKGYQDSYNKWMAGYQRMKEQNDRLQEYHREMLEAYRGRADAYQKAADAARRMTGDLLDQKQQATANKINTFKAQQHAMDELARTKLAMEALHERISRDVAQQARWKALEDAAKKNPAIKQQLAANHAQWQNLKSQSDDLLKRRGQINSSLDLSADAKGAELQKIDDELAANKMSMDSSIAEGEALASSSASGAAAPGGAPAPTDKAVGPGTVKYATANDVRSALQAGKLTQDQARQILVTQFGFH